MTAGFGSRYGRKPGQGYKPYRGAQLGVSVRTGNRPAVEVKLTPTRRGLLEAVEAGKVRDVPSHGWRCERKTVDGLVADCVRAGWVDIGTEGGTSARTIALTPAGRRALGLDEVSA